MPWADPQKKIEYDRRYRVSNRGKIRAYCREWERKQAEQRYGATRPMLDVCECCGGTPTGNGRLHLDHDHITGRFRGWLCQKCNNAIGALGDAIEGLERAIAYLERGSQ